MGTEQPTATVIDEARWRTPSPSPGAGWEASRNGRRRTPRPAGSAGTTRPEQAGVHGQVRRRRDRGGPAGPRPAPGVAGADHPALQLPLPLRAAVRTSALVRKVLPGVVVPVAGPRAGWSRHLVVDASDAGSGPHSGRSAAPARTPGSTSTCSARRSSARTEAAQRVEVPARCSPATTSTTRVDQDCRRPWPRDPWSFDRAVADAVGRSYRCTGWPGRRGGPKFLNSTWESTRTSGHHPRGGKALLDRPGSTTWRPGSSTYLPETPCR
ncbi:hypothetical protein HBB16_00445 [Pseudonocardia sp. MCCB 268]|nr:hypothetical protein [Pseudonocardia cytotoxica]